MLVMPEQEQQATLGRIRVFLASRPETADGAHPADADLRAARPAAVKGTRGELLGGAVRGGVGRVDDEK
jgi:hypothetical protein